MHVKKIVHIIKISGNNKKVVTIIIIFVHKKLLNLSYKILNREKQILIGMSKVRKCFILNI